MNTDPVTSKPIDVVTAFLTDGQRILLAQRSNAVSTFPGHWAAISGYLEGDDPRAWALVEIGEECGVASDHLQWSCAGEPLEARDLASSKVFLVHPMLFWIDDPSQVRHDWEAARFAWVDPEDVFHRKYQPAVPKLEEALRSVWPPPEKILREKQ